MNAPVSRETALLHRTDVGTSTKHPRGIHFAILRAATPRLEGKVTDMARQSRTNYDPRSPPFETLFTRETDKFRNIVTIIIISEPLHRNPDNMTIGRGSEIYSGYDNTTIRRSPPRKTQRPGRRSPGTTTHGLKARTSRRI